MTAERPHLVAQVLLEERDLGLHGEHDVAQRSLRFTMRRDPCENPSAALLVHEAARAVDRIDDHAPAAILLAGAGGEEEAPRRQPFRNQPERFVVRDISQALDERRLAHTIDGVDGVDAVVGRNGSQRLDLLTCTGVQDGGANAVVDREDGLEEPTDVSHLACAPCNARPAPRAALPLWPPVRCR